MNMFVKDNPNPVGKICRPAHRLEAARVEEITLSNASFYDIAQYYNQRSYFAFLDSRLHENNLGNYSVIAFDPFLILKCKGNNLWLETGTGQRVDFEQEPGEDVFAAMDRIMCDYNLPVSGNDGPTPFLGGGIGYFAYELGRQIEKLPVTTRDVMGEPDCCVCFYHTMISCRHENGKNESKENNQKKENNEKIYISYFHPGSQYPVTSPEQIKKELQAIPAGIYHSKSRRRSLKGKKNENSNFLNEFRSDFARGEYLAAIKRIKEYILAGDVYQVGLTQRFETGLGDINPWELYKRLMEMNPSPFAGYLNFNGINIVSSSPERFLRVNNRHVETRPIKGTVKRGATPKEDEENKRFLLNDEKNRAELAMIVDLLRNDLGRVCLPGTVKVESFPELETYSSVHHLVSTITGELPESKNIADVLKAAFPGGSITGAPKIRAMEIIDELEPVERGVYTGSIGYLGFNGYADLNIVIRTIVITGNKVHIQAGGGIVADSLEIDEYEETLLKAQKLFKAIKSIKENIKGK